MKTYTRNEAAPADPFTQRQLYQAIHFWRAKIAHLMDRYYPAYSEAEKLYGRLHNIVEWTEYKKTGKLQPDVKSEPWPDSLWKSLVLPLKDMYSDLDTIYQSVDKDIFRRAKSKMEADQINRFNRAIYYLAAAVVACRKAAQVDVKRVISDKDERAVMQVLVYREVIIPLWTSLVMAWSALFFATADIVKEIKHLSANETEIWHKQVEDIQEKYVKRDAESLKEFFDRVLRESQVMRKGNTTEIVKHRMESIKFVKKTIEDADELATNKYTIVQIFDDHGELVYVGTPTEYQVASEVAHQLRAQHLPRSSTWEWMARGSNVVSHGKTFARPLTLEEKLVAQNFIADEVSKSKAYKELLKASKSQVSEDAAARFRKVSWLSMRKDQFREMPTVSIDEVAKAIDVPLKWEKEERLIKAGEKAEAREAEKLVDALKTPATATMTPNPDTYMEDLSMLRALWQTPMVLTH